MRQLSLARSHPSGPPDAVAHETEDRGDDHSTNNEGVDDHADSDDQTQLSKGHEWQDTKCGEHRGEYDACARDHAAGMHDRLDHSGPGAECDALRACAMHEEDRV